MKIIPLRAVPNQRFTFSNGQDRWVIEIKVAITSMICNLWLNDEPVILGSRIVAGVPIIWAPRLSRSGNFGILTEGGDEPWWEKFDTSQQLVFWESDMAIAASRFVDFRSRHISPSLAELTALVNTAMRIEDIGYYPPTWQALQEAISYALSVVRSHAPEQGQILLATQMLTGAMNDLIEWLNIDFVAREWHEDLTLSRPAPAPYIDASGSVAVAPIDEPRFSYSSSGAFLGLQLEYDIDELATLDPTDWINDGDGTWIINGIFESASLLDDSIQNIDGNSALVMTQTNAGYDFYMNNYRIATGVSGPNTQDIISLNTGGNIYLKSIVYQPQRISATNAVALAENRNLYLNSNVIILGGVS